MPRTKVVIKIAYVYAAILLVMVVSQLFSFDTFLPLLRTFNLPGGRQFSSLLAALLAATEVFALPFLLRMLLSQAFRWVSMICGWLVAIIWIFLSVWLAVHPGLSNIIGFLGTIVDLMPGVWAVGVSVGFALLAAWSAYGLWPGRTVVQK